MLNLVLSTADLANGLYFLEILPAIGKATTHKVIIIH
jgi:hypothetical protein